MDGLTLLVLALGLSMDAFAVSITNGLCYQNFHKKQAIMTAGAFGLFQGLMPVIGYYCGIAFSGTISFLDHWIALVLLGLIGLNMIREAIKEMRDITPICDACQSELTGKTLIMQAIATSIDALAVGISFAIIQVNIFFASSSIAIITFVISLLGCQLGKRFGGLLKEKAQIFGGGILILIGLKIFIEHMFF